MNHFFTYWHFDLLTLAALVLLLVFYLWVQGFSPAKSSLFFGSAFLLLALCYFSPLHVLSEHYLFSAHMVVHVLLLLVAAPLLVMSLSGSQLQSDRHMIRFSRLLHKKPFLGWITGVGIMWFWHVPVVFNSMMSAGHMQSGSFNWRHAVESISLVVSGMLFSWPLITPVRQYRVAPLSGVVYLFTACIGCSLLGLLVTFAPAGMYHHYLSMHDVYNLNDTIVARWGISQGMDQQMAGLIMWVPCCLLYVVYALYLLAGWLNEKDSGKNYVVNHHQP